MFTIGRLLLHRKYARMRCYKISLNLYAKFSNSIGSKFGVAFNMSKKALIVLSTGADEMDSVIITDVLRRGGVNVTIAGLCGEMLVKCSKGLNIKPDTSLECVRHKLYDVVVLPGGVEGSQAMCRSETVGEILHNHVANGRIVAATCSSPIVFLAHCLLTGIGRSLTSYPLFKSELEKHYNYIDSQNVVKDNNLITSRGPGTIFEIALKLVEVLVSVERRNEVAKGLLL